MVMHSLSIRKTVAVMTRKANNQSGFVSFTNHWTLVAGENVVLANRHR